MLHCMRMPCRCCGWATASVTVPERAEHCHVEAGVVQAHRVCVCACACACACVRVYVRAYVCARGGGVERSCTARTCVCVCAHTHTLIRTSANRKERLRIGYMSSDFVNHPTADLIIRALLLHNGALSPACTQPQLHSHPLTLYLNPFHVPLLHTSALNPAYTPPIHTLCV